jgi:hypothetical protein
MCLCLLLCIYPFFLFRLRDAVSLINQFPVKRISVLLNRVLIHLRDQTDEIFNQDEFKQLCDMFSLHVDSVHTLLDSFLYIYEQAAYNLLTSEKLIIQLKEVLQVDEPHTNAIAHVWGENREAYLSNLRERSFGTPAVSFFFFHTQYSMG